MIWRRSGPAWLALFFSAGALSFVAQALLFREYLVLYQGSELVFGLFFGAWLAWVGVGAALGRLALRLPTSPMTMVALLGSAHALAPLLQLTLLRALRELVGIPAWQAFPPDALLAVTMLGNGPVSLLTGALFTVACSAAVYSQRGADAGEVSGRYVAECIGSFAGGAAVTAGIQAGLGDVTLLMCAASPLALSALWCARSGRSRAGVAVAGSTCAALLLAWALDLPAQGEYALEQARWRGVLPQATLVESASTPYQHVAIGRLGDQLVVARDGRLDAALPDEPGHALTAALLFAQRPAARRVLLLGDAATGLLRHVLGRGPTKVVWIDDDPDATRLLRKHLPTAEVQALDDPRVRILEGDPRVLMQRSSPAFDLIALLTADPLTAHGNRLYTREFLAELQVKLATNGVFVSRMEAEPNYLAGDVLTMGASMDRTLRSVFARVEATPGETWWLFAGGTGAPLTVDSAALAQRLKQAPQVPGFAPEQLQGLWLKSRVQWLRARLASARRGGDDRLLNTDRRPSAMLLALAWRLRALGSGAGKVLMGIREAGLWLWLLPLLIGLLIRLLHVGLAPAPRPGSFNGLALVAMAGALGMALVTAWMMAFQGRFGAIFTQVGLVGGLFVLGLAGGGGVGILALRRGGGSQSDRSVPWRLAASCLAAAVAVSASLSPLQDWLAALPEEVAWPLYLSAFLVSGAVSGIALPVGEAILLASRQSTTEVAAGLEAADHLGGAIAAAVVGAIWLPTIGVGGASALLVAGLLAVAALLGQQYWRQTRPAAPTTRPAPWRQRRPSAAAMVGVAIACAAIAGGALLRARLEHPQVRFEPEQLRSWMGAGEFTERDSPFVHYELNGGAALAASMAIAPEVRGYAGPLNVLVAVSPQGELARIRLLETRDTPAYIEGLGQWLRRLEGRPIGVPLRGHALGQPRGEGEVDVLTGATVSSEAALMAINESAAGLATEVLDLPKPSQSAPISRFHRLLDPAVFYLLASFLLAIAVARRAGPRLRRLVLATHVVVGGMLLNTQLSTVELARLARLDLPGPATLTVCILLFGALTLGLAFGPLYCAGLCPLGAAQELLAVFGLGGRLHHRLEDGARKLKYGVLVLVICLAAVGHEAGLLAGDPLRFGLGRQAQGGALLVLGLLVVGSLFVFRPWCRYLCPVGAGLNLLNRVRLLNPWLRPRSYGVCDLGVDGPADVDCLQCDRCVHGCTLPTRGRAPAKAGEP